MTWKRIGFALAAAIAMATPSSDARASEEKLYPASVCERWSGSKFEFYFSSIQPVRRQPTFVDCPVIRGQFLAKESDTLWTTLGVLERTEVTVVDQHPTDDARCVVAAVNVHGDGAYGYVSPSVSSSGVSAIPQTLTLDTSGVYFSWTRHAYLSCSIPGTSDGVRSNLSAYRVFERD